MLKVVNNVGQCINQTIFIMVTDITALKTTIINIKIKDRHNNILQLVVDYEWAISCAMYMYECEFVLFLKFKANKTI